MMPSRAFLSPCVAREDEFVEAELAALLRQGTPAAREQLMRRCNRLLFRAARSIVRDDDTACEVVVATWLRAFAAPDSLPADCCVCPWLLRIAIQEARQLQHTAGDRNG